VDPFHLDEQAVTKRQRLVTHLQQQWATQAEAARQQLARGAALQESVARVMASDAIPAGAAIGPFLTTMGTQITESTLSFTGRSRSARRRKRRELTAMEAIGLRVPGPKAQLHRVTGKGSAAGQRLGLKTQTDPVAVPQAAAPPPPTTPLITPPSTLQGGAEAGQRPGFTARTDPAGAPPPGTLPIIYMPDTESIISPTPYQSTTSHHHPSLDHPAPPSHTTRLQTASACPRKRSARLAAATAPDPAPSNGSPGASEPPPPHPSVR
jgi:hypothetical protein